ncbi:MAG: TetR/AcrR family transcriptional regulator [Beijerinckiaceae bacterium]
MAKVAARREGQRAALIEAAERRIAEGGLQALKARDLAQEIGVALGAIYNLVADMDELVLLVASRTLAKLDVALAAAAQPGRGEDQDPCATLVGIAIAYRQFATTHEKLWRALFEHRMREGKDLPDWAVVDQMSLMQYILRPLKALMPTASPETLKAMASTLFSASHGVVALGLDRKLVAVPEAQLDAQLTLLVRTVCAGLQAQGV